MATPQHVIRVDLESFKSSPLSHNLVVFFVGATSGIGQATLKSFAQYTHSSRIYLAGRNRPAYTQIATEITTKINPSAEVIFLDTGDLTECSAADTVVGEFIKLEEGRVGTGTGKVKLDLLVMSQGYLEFGGRDVNNEGFDRKMVVNYYGRMRFIWLLLPYLRRPTPTTTPSQTFTPQILTIFSAGTESPSLLPPLIHSQNLDLSNSIPERGYRSTETAVSATSTSLALEHLSEEVADVGWLHVHPGYVADTGMSKGLPWVVRLLVYPIVKWVVGNEVGDVGEGMVWLAIREQIGREENGREGSGRRVNGAGLYLGYWNGKAEDWRVVKPEQGKAQEEWDKERREMRRGVWEWLGKVMERVDGLGATVGV